MKTKKKVFTQIQSDFRPRFFNQIPNGGGPRLNFAYYSEVFIHYWRPKGGPWHNANMNTPLNVPQKFVEMLLQNKAS